ncbi:MAG TPA: hypothetical protein VNO52_10755 [Methylomirabilota bacterium]|nr:hypothetical protein [Methylomirabilota bacterium]
MRIAPRPPQDGSILLLTLLTSVIIGITLAAYLEMVNAQARTVYRSQTWNAGIPAAEAGIEEALAHLNTVGDGTRATNGWSLSGTNVTLSRTLDTQSRYEVTISTSSPPVVVATGYMKAPLSTNEIARTVRVTTTKTGTGFRGIVAKGGIELVGNISMNSFDSTDPAYSTNGRYDSSKTKDNGFVGSIESSITGGGGIVYGSVGTGPRGSASSAGTVGDASWHAGGNSGIQSGHYSNDLNLSFPDVSAPAGPYLTPTGGTVTITNFDYTTSAITTNVYPSGFTNTVTTNYGLYTSSTYPSPAPAGTVTTNTTPDSSTTHPDAASPAVPYLGAVTTRTATEGMGSMATTVTYYDYNKITGYTYETVTYTYNATSTNTTTTTETYAYVLDTDSYSLSSLSLSGQSKMLVRGNAILYITGTSGEVFSMTGQSEIIILPGASLTVYCGGDAKLAGNGVQNGTGNALNYQFKGLPTCTSIQLGGNASFTGVIYAPSAYLQAGGGGNDQYDCVGAAIVGSAKFNGHFSFHYDEMLGNQGGATQWNIASWNEM